MFWNTLTFKIIMLSMHMVNEWIAINTALLIQNIFNNIDDVILKTYYIYINSNAHIFVIIEDNLFTFSGSVHQIQCFLLSTYLKF